MKRILSILLAAMLLVGCLSTVAFAAGTKKVDITVSVGGTFSNFTGKVTSSYKIVDITGITGNASSGKVSFASSKNVKGTSFTVTVEVPEDICGETVSVSFKSTEADKMAKDDDGNRIFKSVKLSGSGSKTYDHSWGEYVETTPAADCKTPAVLTRTCSKCGETETKDGELGSHKWGDWITDTDATCHTDGTKHKECSVCGETKDGTIPATGKHVADSKWHQGEKTHWHVCTTDGCGEKLDQAEHDWTKWETVKKATEKEKGEKKRECKVCGKTVTAEIPKVTPSKLPVPDMGDTTPYGTYNAIVFVIAMIAVFSVYALVSKRKSVK